MQLSTFALLFMLCITLAAAMPPSNRNKQVSPESGKNPRSMKSCRSNTVRRRRGRRRTGWHKFMHPAQSNLLHPLERSKL